MPELQVIDRPGRWDVPFARELPDPDERRDMTDEDVDAVMAFTVFARMDPDRFPRSQPLRDIVRYDTRIRRFRNGDVIVRQGDYGNSAFLIMKGEVRVLKNLEARVLGRRERRPRSLLRSLTQYVTNPRTPEVRDTRRYERVRRSAETARRVEHAFAQGVTNALEVMPSIFEDLPGETEPAGAMFGELAALGRTPRSASVLSCGDAELLEIRWQGLRDLRKHDDALKQYLDDRYRTFRLRAAMTETPLLALVPAASAQEIALAAEFETYGQYDWYGSYRKLRKRQADPLAHEPVIAREGHYPNGLVLIRTGFARLSRRHGHGERTLSYLGPGDVYGLTELIHNATTGEQVPLATSLRAIGFVDIVRIPTKTFEDHILRHLPPGCAPQHPAEDAARAPDPGGERRRREVPPPVVRSPGGEPSGGQLDPALLEFLVEHRFINGTATMVIDMDRCTRCDDCVRACAAGHENNPVFVRHGPTFGRSMIANACMHCVDPVCMIGCPTGAIHRDEDTGNVVINDLTCIGCTVCATNCPYDNIRMVEIRDGRSGEALCVGPAGQPILKATKCDLCADHHGGPACERACPHDALRRLDMRDQRELAGMLER